MKKFPVIIYSFSKLSNQDMYILKEETFKFGNLFPQNIWFCSMRKIYIFKNSES